MSLTRLQGYTRKKLAGMAKRRQVFGWHGMRKQELIEALLAINGSNSKKTPRHARTASKNGSSAKRRSATVANGKNGRSRRNGKKNGASVSVSQKSYSKKVAVKPVLPSTRRPKLRSTVLHGGPGSETHDSLVARVCDPYWIHAQWQIRAVTIERARAALGIEWHRAVPVIRVFDVTPNETATASETWVRDIAIHGDVDHWYVPVDHPPACYKLQIGYRTQTGKFFGLIHSRRVKTPKPGRGDSTNPENSFARLTPRPETELERNGDMGPSLTSVSESLESNGKSRKNGQAVSSDFALHLDAELVVYGTTHPNAKLSLLGEPIPVGSQGTFSVQVSLADGRQVIPTVAVSPDGREARTVVLAIERNTRVLDPQPLDELPR